MTKLFTIFLSFCSIGLYAQNCPTCIPSLPPNMAEDTIYLDEIPEATVGTYYEETISFRLPQTTTAVVELDSTIVPGINLDAIRVTAVNNLPAGISWTVNQDEYDLPDETDGCITLCGTALTFGDFDIEVSLTAQISILSQSTSVSLPMSVVPATSSTDGFTLVNNTGCGEVEVNLSNNVPSNGVEGFSYNWSFGNGLTSTEETPPNQVYDSPGTYYINYEATIDTVGYLLTQIDVETASCDDVSIPLVTNGEPELYIRILDANENLLYQSTYVDDTAAPVSFDFNVDLLPGENYTLEIWDEDGGIDGMDDRCGSINFNTESTGIIENGDVSASMQIFHPVTTVTAMDSVQVFPIPDMPILTEVDISTACAEDELRLVVENYSENVQWFMDAEIVGTDPVYTTTIPGTYWAVYTNEFGCTSASEQVIYTPTPLPASPVYVNENNLLSLYELVELPDFYAFQWYLDGALLEDETESSHCSEVSGDYTLELTDLMTGCSNTFNSTIIINDAFDCTVGLENLIAQTVDVFPNPFHNEISIQGNEPIYRIVIWDMLGQKKWQQAEANQINWTINTDFLSKGIYVLEVESEAGIQLIKVLKK